MSHQLRPHARRISALFGVVVAALLIVVGSVTRSVHGDNAAMKTSPAMQLANLGMKFNGSGSCKGSGCHNKSGDKTPPAETLHELSIWKAKDLHAKSFEALSNKDSKEIVGKLKIADAAKSDKCLSCHALNVDAKLAGRPTTSRKAIAARAAMGQVRNGSRITPIRSGRMTCGPRWITTRC